MKLIYNVSDKPKFGQLIVFAESTAEDRHDLTRDGEKGKTEERHERKIDDGKRSAEHECHHERKDEHKGRADRNTNEHHERLLDVRYVRCQTGHKAGGRKLIDVGKGIVLNLMIKVAAQIFSKATGRRRAEPTRKHAARKRSHRKTDENKAVFENGVHLTARLNTVDKRRGNKRNDTFNDDLKRNEERRERSLLFVFADTLRKPFDHFDHRLLFPFPFIKKWVLSFKISRFPNCFSSFPKARKEALAPFRKFP